jgi:hypothetical protein
MLKNITLSAEKAIIERARRRAEARNTTLNSEFRHWITQYVDYPQTTADLTNLMARLNYAKPDKTFSRDELNER